MIGLSKKEFNFAFIIKVWWNVIGTFTMKFVLLGNSSVSVHSCNRICPWSKWWVQYHYIHTHHKCMCSCNWICHDKSDECNFIIFIHITSVQFDYVINHEAHWHTRKLNPHLLNWNPNPELLAPNFNLSKIMSQKYRHVYATSSAVWFSMCRIKHEVASFTKIKAHVRWNWTHAQI